MNELTNVMNDGKMVATFEFITKDGKSLVARGATAIAVDNFFKADLLSKNAGLLKARAYAKLNALDSEELKTQYGVKSGKAFYQKFLDGSDSNFEKLVLAYNRACYEDEDGNIHFFDERLRDFGMTKIMEITSRYFADANESCESEEIADATAREMIVKALDSGIINSYMTVNAIVKAVKHDLEKTIDIPESSVGEAPKDNTGEAPKDNTGEAPKDNTGEAPKDKLPEAKPSDMVVENSVMYTALKKLGLAMDMYNELKIGDGFELKTAKEKKLAEVLNAFVKASEYTMEIFKRDEK